MTATDLERVLEVNEANVPEVGPVDLDRLRFLVEESAFSLVVDVDGVVAGFCVTVAGDESAVSKFGTGAVRAGWLGSIIGIIAIFGSAGFASGDLSQIGPALAVCSLTVFYGYFFKIGAIILEG